MKPLHPVIIHDITIIIPHGIIIFLVTYIDKQHDQENDNHGYIYMVIYI